LVLGFSDPWLSIIDHPTRTPFMAAGLEWMEYLLGIGLRMKRFILLVMVVLLVTWAVRTAHRGRPPWPKYEPGGWSTHDIHDRYRAAYDDNHADRHDPHGAMGEVRVALHEARKEIRDAWKEVRREVADAYREVRESISDDERGIPPAPPVPPVPAFPAKPPAPPCSIAARIEPQRNADVWERFQKEPRDADAAPVSTAEESAAVRVFGNAPVTGYEFFEPIPGTKDVSKVTGRISATEGRAKTDARRAVVVAIREWLGPNVSSSWAPPDRLVDSMILSVHTEPVIKDYGRLYIADFQVDTSPNRRAALVNAYNRETVRHRLLAMGGALAFVLTCLAAFTGYVRADEATKGYYTNRLRTVVAAGIGAAGVVIYQMVA
jgi:hypothetical protein